MKLLAASFLCVCVMSMNLKLNEMRHIDAHCVVSKEWNFQDKDWNFSC